MLKLSLKDHLRLKVGSIGPAMLTLEGKGLPVPVHPDGQSTRMGGITVIDKMSKSTTVN